MAIVTIEQIGQSAKITDSNGEILYSWLTGRFLIKADSDTIEAINNELSTEDQYHKRTFKYSDQTQVYGTTTAVEFVEHLILNDIFFSDAIVETISAPEAVKLTEVGTILYIGKAKAGSLEADPVWKCSKFDETIKTAQTMKWADGANYSQIATDLTTLTYA